MLTVRRYLIPTVGVGIEDAPSTKQNKRPPLREALNNQHSLESINQSILYPIQL
jgi:hypothetical protein